MFKKIINIGFCLFSFIVFSQVGGKSVYQFMNLVTSPRQAALGGKIITLYDKDVNQGHFNPAALNPEMENKLAMNYGSYFGEVTYGTAAYAFAINKNLETCFAGVNYINYGSFEGYDENGNNTSNFTGSETALVIGSAYNIPKSNVYVGTNLKLISSTFESYNSIGLAMDIGAVYRNEVKQTDWALAVRNIGTQITLYNETREKLPLEIIAGVSHRMAHIPVRWHLTLENMQQWQVAFSNPNRAQGSLDGTATQEKVSVFNNALRHVVFGFEIFPEKSFNLRMSYNFRRGEELRVLEQRNFSGISVGFGLKYNKLKFNYSYSKYTVAANSSLFGLTIDFSR